jgi:hypothetical protein
MRVDLRRRVLHPLGLFVGPAPGRHRRRSSAGGGGPDGHSERGEEIDPGDEITLVKLRSLVKPLTRDNVAL